jgi:hypothetical protein
LQILLFLKSFDYKNSCFAKKKMIPFSTQSEQIANWRV